MTNVEDDAAVLRRLSNPAPTSERAYELGWLTCAAWAGRSDLICDVDSPAYLAYRDKVLKPATPPPPAGSREAAPDDAELVERLRREALSVNIYGYLNGVRPAILLEAASRLAARTGKDKP